MGSERDGLMKSLAAAPTVRVGVSGLPTSLDATTQGGHDAALAGAAEHARDPADSEPSCAEVDPADGPTFAT